MKKLIWNKRRGINVIPENKGSRSKKSLLCRPLIYLCPLTYWNSLRDREKNDSKRSLSFPVLLFPLKQLYIYSYTFLNINLCSKKNENKARWRNDRWHIEQPRQHGSLATPTKILRLKLIKEETKRKLNNFF